MTGIGEVYENQITGEQEVARFVSGPMTRPRHHRVRRYASQSTKDDISHGGDQWIHNFRKKP